MEPHVEDTSITYADFEDLRLKLKTAQLENAALSQRVSLSQIGRLQAALPQRFDGSMNNGAVDRWVEEVDAYLRCAGAEDNPAALDFAATYLTGTAQAWWRANKLQLNRPSNWAEFRVAILTAFRSVDAAVNARDRAHSLRQRSTVAAYTSEFLSLCTELADMAPVDALYLYIRGLKDQIRLQLRLQRPTELTAAITLAHHTESALHANTATNDRPQHQPTEPFLRASSRPLQQRFQPTRTVPSATNGVQPMDLGNRRVQCWFCGKLGHTQRYCPTRPQNSPAAIHITDVTANPNTTASSNDGASPANQVLTLWEGRN